MAIASTHLVMFNFHLNYGNLNWEDKRKRRNKLFWMVNDFYPVEDILHFLISA